MRSRRRPSDSLPALVIFAAASAAVVSQTTYPSDGILHRHCVITSPNSWFRRQFFFTDRSVEARQLYLRCLPAMLLLLPYRTGWLSRLAGFHHLILSGDFQALGFLCATCATAAALFPSHAGLLLLSRPSSPRDTFMCSMDTQL